jgi:hypothetical protein
MTAAGVGVLNGSPLSMSLLLTHMASRPRKRPVGLLLLFLPHTLHPPPSSSSRSASTGRARVAPRLGCAEGARSGRGGILATAQVCVRGGGVLHHAGVCVCVCVCVCVWGGGGGGLLGVGLTDGCGFLWRGDCLGARTHVCAPAPPPPHTHTHTYIHTPLPPWFISPPLHVSQAATSSASAWPSASPVFPDVPTTLFSTSKLDRAQHRYLPGSLPHPPLFYPRPRRRINIKLPPASARNQQLHPSPLLLLPFRALPQAVGETPCSRPTRRRC